MITKIWDRISVGTFKDARQLAVTNPTGITAVLSLCTESVWLAENIKHSHIPISDTRPVSKQEFDEIMTSIALAVQHGNLLVHCVAGMCRSPIMIAAWMHRCGYAAIDRALAEISDMREIEPSPVLLKSAREHLNR